jgi:hypothetical protein
MSIFGKWPPRVEIFIHHHLFGIRPANLAGVIVTIMLYFFIIFIIISYHCGVNMVELSGRVGGDSGGII